MPKYNRAMGLWFRIKLEVGGDFQRGLRDGCAGSRGQGGHRQVDDLNFQRSVKSDLRCQEKEPERKRTRVSSRRGIEIKQGVKGGRFQQNAQNGKSAG